MDVNAYAKMLTQLLPRGSLFNRAPGSGLHKLMLGIAEELARVDARGLALLEEADPRTALETLPEWELMLGLPDDAVQVVPATVEGRRLAIVSKLLKPRGQSRGFFIELAAACGYSGCTVYEYGKDVFRVQAAVEAPLYDTQWAHAWQLNVPAPSGTALSHAELERIIRRAAPAHTVVIFNYL